MKNQKTETNPHHQIGMKNKLEIIFTIGLIIGFLVLIIPFADIMNEINEDRLFFRGILLAGLLFSLYGSIVFNGFLKSISMSIGGGVLTLTVISTYNLICKGCINTYSYYLITFIVTILLLIILTAIKLWVNYTHRIF